MYGVTAFSVSLQSHTEEVITNLLTFWCTWSFLLLHPLNKSSSCSSTMNSPKVTTLFLGQYWAHVSCNGPHVSMLPKTNDFWKDNASNLLIFFCPAEHDNRYTIPVCDHLPEVSASTVHRALGNDECLLFLIALQNCQFLVWNHETFNIFAYLHNDILCG